MPRSSPGSTKMAWEGDNKQTDTRTSQLLDRICPVGRFGENCFSNLGGTSLNRILHTSSIKSYAKGTDKQMNIATYRMNNYHILSHLFGTCKIFRSGQRDKQYICIFFFQINSVVGLNFWSYFFWNIYTFVRNNTQNTIFVAADH